MAVAINEQNYAYALKVCNITKQKRINTNINLMRTWTRKKEGNLCIAWCTWRIEIFVNVAEVRVGKYLTSELQRRSTLQHKTEIQKN